MKLAITKPQHTLLLVLTLVLATTLQYSHAQVYKTVDEKGKVTFSDKPDKDAEPVEIKEPNTAKPVDVRDRLPTSTDEAPSYSVAITSPADQQLFANRLEPFTVTTKVTPALNENHRLRLTIDGKTHSISVGNFDVSSLPVGEHTLQVAIIDAEDAVISQSKAIKIFSRNPGQTSSNSPKPSPPIQPTPRPKPALPR